MDVQPLFDLFDGVSAAVAERLSSRRSHDETGARDGQYVFDVAADEVAVALLRAAGHGVLSEESGLHGGTTGVTVVIDPVDGSTNFAAGLPWYATSLCAVDDEGPLASLVVNHATGDRWQAARGAGAQRNGRAIEPNPTTALDTSLVALSGLPNTHLGWKQFRCYGAAALDICAVADGTFDAFADLSVDAHGIWDYVGALLVLTEAGGHMVDLHERDLVDCPWEQRRTPVAAATPELLAALRASVHASTMS